MLVSNNWHDVIFDHAERLGFDIVAKAMKPFSLAFRKAMRRLGVKPRECVVVGDHS
jgi:HAD superfamily hydrolase (TIGR01509 family)